MSEIQYFRATVKDIKELVDSRIDFQTSYWGAQQADRVHELRTSLEQYLSKAIEASDYISWFAKIEDEIAGVGGMVIRVQPGNLKNPSGRTGYIMNMYTVAAHRRKGIGSAILEKLIRTAREMGIGSFELHATKYGEPVYKKAGFELHDEPTYRVYG